MNTLKAIPNGTYHLKKDIKGRGTAEASMVVENEKFAIKAGTRCFKPKDGIWIPKALKNANIVDGVLQEDLECRSPSTVAWIVLGRSNNGWELWKTVTRKIINRYRKS